MTAKACSGMLLRIRPSLISCNHLPRRHGGLISANAAIRRRPAPSSSRLFSTSTIEQAKKYTEQHEWIELDSDGTTGTIGISKYAANALGDVVYVELPTADAEFNAGDSIGAVESVKSASDIISPVTGTIIEANKVLEDTPGIINKSPESEAWIAKIKVKDTSELDALMDGKAYQEFSDDL